MIWLLFAFIALAACQTTCSTGITNQVVGWVFSGGSTNTAAQTCNTFYSNIVLSTTSSPALPSGFSSGAGSYSLQSSNFLGDTYNIRVGHVPASSTNGGSDPGTSFISTTTILTVSSSKSLNANTFTSISAPAGRKPAISICCSNAFSVCSNVAASSLNICWDTTSTGPALTTTVPSATQPPSPPNGLCTTTPPPSVTTSTPYCVFPPYSGAAPTEVVPASLQFSYQSTNTLLGNTYTVQYGSVPVGTPAGSCAGFSGFSNAIFTCVGGTTGSNRVDCANSVSWNWGTAGQPSPIPAIRIVNNNVASTINWNTAATTNQVCWEPPQASTTTLETTSPVTPDPGNAPFCGDVQLSTTTAGTFTHTCRVTGPIYSQSRRDNVVSIRMVGNGIGGSFTVSVTPSGSTSCIDRCFSISSGTWSLLNTASINRVSYFNTLVDYRVVVTSPSTSGSISFTPAVVETIVAAANCSSFFCNGGSCAWSRMCTASGASISFSPYCTGLRVDTSLCPQSTSTCCPTTGAAPCFHRDTVITYDKVEYSGLAEIRSLGECSIPHVVRSIGVIVKARCSSKEHSLRLTDGHLIFTQRGLQAAIDLKPGVDSIYADLEEAAKCTVVSVTKETQQQEYFGLNCHNSQVLANGLKASTFEKFHSIPAFWMKIMGRIIGIKRASSLGDYVAELAHKMKLV